MQLFGTMMMFLTHEKTEWFAVYFQQVTHLSEGDKVQDIPASHTLHRAMRYKCLTISSEEGIFQSVKDSPL
jgi:hypothetical protein